MDNIQKSPNVLSLCTGYGGIELGLGKALGGIIPLAHVEIEAYTIANLVDKMETGQMAPAPIWTNLKTFRPRIFRNHVDILTGGYPCQPFSQAGKRDGSKDPRHLWPWIRSAIKVVQPKICFFENVEGHISLGLREVLADLVKLGYRVESNHGEPTWGLFSAAEVGAPHQRKRVFILAYRECPERWPDIQGRDTPNRDGSGREKTSNWIGTCSKKLANSDMSGATSSRVYSGVGRKSKSIKKALTQWPARPDELQHEWEEPRVVNSKSPQRRLASHQDNPGGRVEKTGRPNRTHGQNGTSQPGLGRAINGAPGGLDTAINRIDRLRLCGNGVMPQTAEKAFRTLWGRVVNPSPDYVQPSIQMEMF